MAKWRSFRGDAEGTDVLYERFDALLTAAFSSVSPSRTTLKVQRRHAATRGACQVAVHALLIPCIPQVIHTGFAVGNRCFCPSIEGIVVLIHPFISVTYPL